MDRFELEGSTYYQQGRACGKPGCHCADGTLHGPYWWQRNHLGRVAYIGKELPEGLQAARAAHDHLLTSMVADRRELIRKADTLARLIGNRPLSGEDRATIDELGYGACLVSRPIFRKAPD